MCSCFGAYSEMRPYRYCLSFLIFFKQMAMYVPIIDASLLSNEEGSTLLDKRCGSCMSYQETIKACRVSWFLIIF
jgi:hypothetical protein